MTTPTTPSSSLVDSVMAEREPPPPDHPRLPIKPMVSDPMAGADEGGVGVGMAAGAGVDVGVGVGVGVGKKRNTRGTSQADALPTSQQSQQVS